MKRSVVLVGHGSKLEHSGEALKQVCESLRKKEPDTFFQVAFLEITSPSIPEAVDLCFKQGADEVIIVPYFVQSGKHVNQHIPQIVSEIQARHPAKSIRLARHLDFDERIVAVVLDRIRVAQALFSTVVNECGRKIPPNDG